MGKTIIFDLGGVLVHLHWDGLCGRLAELSDCDAEEVRREVMNGPIVESAMRGLLQPRAYHESLCGKLGIDLAYEEFTEIWNGLLSANEAIVPMVEQLKSGYPLVLGSNTDQIHFTYSLKEFPVLGHLGRYFLSYEMGLLKPEPEFFRHILRGLDVPAGDCIFIDDRPENVESAVGTGITAFQFEDIAKLRGDLDSVL